MKNHIKLLASSVAAALLAGCATGGSIAPGGGFGSDYVPVVDMQGVEPTKFDSDLEDCRRYARSIDVGRSALAGAAGAAAFGAILAAALGGRRADSLALARSGLFTGAVEGTAAAGGKQQNILLNCLVGRGYRPLEIASAYVPPPPAPAPLAEPVTVQPVEETAPPAMPQAAPANAVLPAPQPLKANAGIDSFSVERMPEVLACNPNPVPQLIAKLGNTRETYTVACVGGDVVTVRCEWGNCRVLK